MGADWYCPIIFFGILFPIENVGALVKAKGSGEIKLPPSFKVTLFMEYTHSRAEGEEFDEMIKRCKGFLGISGAYTLAEIKSFEGVFKSFLEENKDKLHNYDTYADPSLLAGFDAGLDLYYDVYGYGEEEEDEEEEEEEEEEEDE
jgi:hypothetical protein